MLVSSVTTCIFSNGQIHATISPSICLGQHTIALPLTNKQTISPPLDNFLTTFSWVAHDSLPCVLNVNLEKIIVSASSNSSSFFQKLEQQLVYSLFAIFRTRGSHDMTYNGHEFDFTSLYLAG